MNIRTILLLLIACLAAGTVTRAQTITYTKKNASLKDILKVVQRQAGYGHIFKGETAERMRRVNISVRNASVKEVLDEFFRDQPYTYTIIAQLISIQPKEPLPSDIYTVSGRIVNESNEPVPGATIRVKGANRIIAGNDDGEFLIPDISKTATLIISTVNYEPLELQLSGQPMAHIQLKKRVSELSEVSVVATGYQTIAKERSAGSYTKINNELFNRRVSPNVLDRLDDVTPGMIMNKNIVSGTNQSSRTIRGRSTIFSNAEPLIVIDNFPLIGDPGNINPNDIESITILKDASAASIWGAFAGNGVIVITTRKGRYRQEPRLQVNTNFTVGEKPDAWYKPVLSSKDYIALERDLFERGFYDGQESDPLRTALSPVVESLIEHRDGIISGTELESRLARWEKIDTRKEIDKYLYQPSINQQYAINVSGGGHNNNYYLSAGFDNNRHNLVGNNTQRVTLNASNSYAWFKNRLELSTAIAFSESKIENNHVYENYNQYPYLEFFDESGNPQPIPFGIRQSFKNTLNYDTLLNWNFNPIEDIRAADNTYKVADYRVNAGLKYKISKSLVANILYQFNRGRLDQVENKNLNTYFTRDMINRFTQIEGGEIFYRVPKGAIGNLNEESYKAHNIRAQLNFARSWVDLHKQSHNIAAVGGIEVRDIRGEIHTRRIFDYKKGSSMGYEIDDSTYFPLYHAPYLSDRIPNPKFDLMTIDRYISYYVSAAYTYREKYTLSASARKDESNLFGVRTNQKGIPLYSIGAGWDISREHFFTSKWINFLKIRATHGYNGNVNKSVSAYTTAKLVPSNSYGVMAGTIVNPPNPDLRWEKIQITNFGIDFRTTGEIIEGSIEYYIKKGTDLIGLTRIDPTNGVSEFTGNVASMKGSGFDISITTRNINRQIKWSTILLFNHAIDKITNYGTRYATIAEYYNATKLNPLADRPLYAVYALKWEGLDPLTGDPRGRLNGSISTDYNSILSSTNLKDLIYVGPANPTLFGALRNVISWRQFELSLNITWRAGHYFRRPTIQYLNTFYGFSPGHIDYVNRWQKPGDELVTYIPSSNYSYSISRDEFFENSEVLVEKGDNIRLQDIRVSYEMNRSQSRKLLMQSLSIYFYVNNVGLLWKATKHDIDPDYYTSIPNPRTWTMGIKMEF